MSFFTLNDFHEVAGNTEFSGAQTISWTDQLATICIYMFVYYSSLIDAGVSDFLVSNDKIWTPK